MVLQRQKSVQIWGWAEAGKEVSLSFAGQRKTAVSDAAGCWRVQLDAMEASAEGRSLSIECGNESITLSDILVGEVWMAGGQSNMARTFKVDQRNGYTKRTQQMKDAEHPLMRFINLNIEIAAEPQQDLDPAVQKDVAWKAYSSQTTIDSCVLPYFFGKEILETQNVPVGLIQHCVSGTGSHTWIQKEILEQCAPKDLEHANKHAAKKIRKKWTDKDGLWNGLREWKEAYQASVVAGNKKHPRYPVGMNEYNVPHVLYNGLIRPLEGYTCRGMIWHRGEGGSSDIEHANKYKAMIDHWRTQWNDDFWLIVGSLTNLGPRENGTPDPANTYLINEQYWMNIENIEEKGFAAGKACMVALNDLGNSTTMTPEEFEPANAKNGVHYEAKDIAGHRYALTARSAVYGDTAPDLLNPLFESSTIEAGRIIITIKNTGTGLIYKEDKKEGDNAGFVIEDSSGTMHYASMTIKGNRITVWKDGVDNPKAVYYGFHKNPVLTIYNSNDLPLLSFRTKGFGLRLSSK